MLHSIKLFFKTFTEDIHELTLTEFGTHDEVLNIAKEKLNFFSIKAELLDWSISTIA